MGKRKTKTYRAFLEPASSGIDSYVSVNVEDDHNWINLTIADCGERIILSFGLFGRNRQPRMMRKLEKLEKALAMIRAALEEAGQQREED